MPITALPFSARLSTDSSDQQELTLLREALTAEYAVDPTGTASQRVQHLDTADWRLRRAGIDLVWLPELHELIASSTSDETILQRVETFEPPTLIDAVPSGPVRDLIAETISIRALIAFATTRADTTDFDVRNGDDKTVARLRWFSLALQTPVQEPMPARLAISRLRGYADDAIRVERRLTAGTALVADRSRWSERLWSSAGIGPAENRRFGMRPDQAADLAVADALLGYLAVLEGTVDGITGDIDTEFLHDFRVAVRRTRSVLKLLGDVLPEGVAAQAAPEFRWLGDVSTPTRDLDVYLLSLDDLAATVSRPADLAPFGDHVRKRRRSAHRRLVTQLRSPRFRALCADWRAELARVVSAPTQQGLTAAQLAEHRLHRTFGKVMKRAQAISAGSPAEDIHSLRKTCKEMRYLLDVFKPLCDPSAHRKVISDFKQIQDVLGEFQDGEVQADALHRFAAEMIAAGNVDADVLLAMGELSGHFEERQRVARTTITENHDRFLGKPAAGHVAKLIRSRGRS